MVTRTVYHTELYLKRLASYSIVLRQQCGKSNLCAKKRTASNLSTVKKAIFQPRDEFTTTGLGATASVDLFKTFVSKDKQLSLIPIYFLF
jgi:hypothetical protein